MKYSFFMLLLITAINLKISAQPTADLVLPKKADDVVGLNISSFPKSIEANLTYDELAVFVTNVEGNIKSAPIQGKFSIKSGYLIFAPYYPFEEGLTYTVRIKDMGTNKYHFSTFALESNRKHEVAELQRIHPLADALPENLLRFYFYFSTPMKKGEALNYIHLVDSKGNIDKHAFMQFKQELWSPDGRRLTLLFDPGRIKRGVATNLELGPALLEGNTYQLIVSREWQDIYGQKLSANYTKQFSVVAPYRDSIDIKEKAKLGQIENSLDPITISFNRLMDHTLVNSMLTIQNENKKMVLGHWETNSDETKVFFFPHEAWCKGKYQIIIDGCLEDICGNNLSNLLDQKINTSDKITRKNLIISITI